MNKIKRCKVCKRTIRETNKSGTGSVDTFRGSKTKQDLKEGVEA